MHQEATIPFANANKASMKTLYFLLLSLLLPLAAIDGVGLVYFFVSKLGSASTFTTVAIIGFTLFVLFAAFIAMRGIWQCMQDIPAFVVSVQGLTVKPLFLPKAFTIAWTDVAGIEQKGETVLLYPRHTEVGLPSKGYPKAFKKGKPVVLLNTADMQTQDLCAFLCAYYKNETPLPRISTYMDNILYTRINLAYNLGLMLTMDMFLLLLVLDKLLRLIHVFPAVTSVYILLVFTLLFVSHGIDKNTPRYLVLEQNSLKIGLVTRRTRRRRFYTDSVFALADVQRLELQGRNLTLVAGGGTFQYKHVLLTEANMRLLQQALGSRFMQTSTRKK